MNWTTSDIPDQSGRVAVITGANTGLGYITARELVRAGAYVVIAVRDVEKGEAARATLLRDVGDGPGGAEVRHLDLNDLYSVRDFADGVRDWRIETLVNNAGIMLVPYGQTAQGNESHFGINVLGHFLLTNLLLPNLTDRVVWLSSTMHTRGRIDLDDLNYDRRRYSSLDAYAQSKLACLMLAYELQRRFVREGSTKRSVAAHPGFSATDLFRHGSSGLGLFFKFSAARGLMSQSPEEGALCPLYAATVPDLPGGTYIGPSGPFGLSGPPRPVSSSAASYELDVARRLWDACAELTGLA